MNVLDLLERLARAGARLNLDDAGRLVVDGFLDDHLLALVREYRELLLWTARARGTHHGWAPCDACGELILFRPSSGRGIRGCAITPRCRGHHRRSERNP